MKVSTSSWIHRTIRRLDRFEDKRDNGDLLKGYAHIGTEILGVYRNLKDNCAKEILVTDVSLIILGEDGRIDVAFNEIVDIKGPEKGTGGNIVIKLRNGRTIRFTISGKHGRFEDVFTFLRFLDRVVESEGTAMDNAEKD